MTVLYLKKLTWCKVWCILFEIHEKRPQMYTAVTRSSNNQLQIMSFESLPLRNSHSMLLLLNIMFDLDSILNLFCLLFFLLAQTSAQSGPMQICSFYKVAQTTSLPRDIECTERLPQTDRLTF